MIRRSSISLVLLLCRLAWRAEANSELSKGDAALAQGHFTAAINAYSAALEKDANSALILGKRGSAFLAQGTLARALADFNAAVEADPSAHGTLLKRAKLHRRLGSLEEAIADVNTILDKRPTHKAALKERDVIQQQTSLWTRIQDPREETAKRQLLSSFLDASPSNTAAKLQQAHLLLKEGDYGGVVLMTGQILKQNPADTTALCLRGRAHHYLGDMQLAKKHFSEALRSDPDHAEAKSWFKSLKALLKKSTEAKELAKGRDHAKAEEIYSELVGFQNLPEIVQQAFWWEICKLRVKLERAKAAIDACSYSVKTRPDDEDAVVQKVKALILDKQFAVASQEAASARQRWQSSQAIYEVYREAELAQKMAERKQYYDILNVSKQSSEIEIKRAYRDLARRFHPDKAVMEGLTVEAAQERFVEISEAYEVLSDPEQRQAYDEGRDLQIGAGQAGGGFAHPGHPFQGFSGFPGGFQGSFQFRYG